jgi:hypothetical protein
VSRYPVTARHANLAASATEQGASGRAAQAPSTTLPGPHCPLRARPVSAPPAAVR